jgi:hypothetical protein
MKACISRRLQSIQFTTADLFGLNTHANRQPIQALGPAAKANLEG